MTFPSPNTTRGGKVENRARMTWFCTWNIPTQFTVQFLSFPISTTKKVSIKFWQLFQAQTLPEKGKLKTGPEWLDFAPKTYPYSLRCSSYCFPLLRLNNVLVEFDEVSSELQKFSQTRMTQFGTQKIPTLFKVHFLSFPISSSQAGKVENRAPMTWFCTRNIHTLFEVQFLSFLVKST